MSREWKTLGNRMVLPPGPKNRWSVETRPGGWSILSGEWNGKPVRFRVFGYQDAGRLDAVLGGRLWAGEWIEKTFGSDGDSNGDGDLVAQFPGKVRKVLVQPGQSVEEGEPLVTVEAMKMEFAVKAPRAGVVSQVLVKDGQQISPGDAFVELEEDS